MLAQRIEFGPVAIVAAPGWRFFPGERQIAARADTRVGVLQLHLDLAGNVPPPRSHPESLALARSFAPAADPDQPPIHDVHTRAGGRLVGAMSYYAGQDYVRLYYVHEDSCLIPIWYACKADRRADHDCEREVSACDMMVASIQIKHDGIGGATASPRVTPMIAGLTGDGGASPAPLPEA